MSCVPPKSGSQNPVSAPLSLSEALVLAGVYEPVEGERSFDPVRMERLARLLAAEPEMPNLRAARELEMSRSTVIRYGRHLRGLIKRGELDLVPYADELEDPSQGMDEYDPAESLNVTLRLIQGQKKRLEKKQRGGDRVSTQQILQLVDAEKKLLSIPQRADDVPKDFYDQLFGRVPLADVTCPRCGDVISGGGGGVRDAERRRADFEELGTAGDLAGDDSDGEQMKEVCDA